MAPQTAPYGTWKSPITADFFVESGVSFSGVDVNQKSGKIYLHETRPDGRGVIVEVTETGSKDVLPEQYSAATHVHEYGGAAFCVRESDGHIIFSDDTTKGVFELNPETGKVVPIVEQDPEYYYADFTVHPTDSKWVIAIREDHHVTKIEDIKNTLVAIDTTTQQVHAIAEGADFYVKARFSPDGKKVSWVQWYHPNMPWDYTELWVGDWVNNKIENPTSIVTQEAKESIAQPLWSPDGSLLFISDRSGFWQFYHWTDGKIEPIKAKGLEDSEFAFTEWFLGNSTWTPLTADTIVAFPNKSAYSFGVVIDVKTGDWHDLKLPVADVTDHAVARVSETSFVVLGTGAKTPKALYLVDVSTGDYKTLKASSTLSFSGDYIAEPKAITFPRKYGSGGVGYGLYLPPTNADFTGPEGELPPLIVAMHGGPTFGQFGALSMRDQYWASRGYALVEVNYVGSSGFGKAYRALLHENWGVEDIADAANVVEYLASEGLIDKNRVGITGHSAGGYATLMGICSPWRHLFKAAVGESGISDMKVLVEETHKFESYYLEALCFKPSTSEEDRERILKERSPMHLIDNVKAPLMMTTGREDKIVPPNQAEMMAENIRRNGGIVKLCTYDGEGHILINGQNVKDSILETEKWWQQYLLN